MTIDLATNPSGWSIQDHLAATAGEVSVVETIDAVLSMLEQAPPSVLIGPPLSLRARARAVSLDQRGRDGLPLYGVPFVVKDNIAVSGEVLTAGCPGYARVADRSATVVSRLEAAGAILVGRTNMDQFATGLVGTRSPYGTPMNTLDPALVPGGSSSGSAVAVALGLVPFALGTDTAGSGRVPAALNSIVGLKPTVGSMSTAGIVPAVRRFDCPSVFARSVAEAGLVGEIMRGHDPRDPFSRPTRASLPMRTRPVVGIPASWPDELEISEQMQRWFEGAVERLDTLEVDVRPVDIAPLLELGALLYGSAIVAERTSVVGAPIAAGIDGLDPVVTGIISAGQGWSAVDAFLANNELTARKAVAAEIWADIDVLALPTTPDVTTIEAVAADPVGRNAMLGRLTSFVNLLDAMCVVVPIRPQGAAVPAGLQLVAPAWQDDEVLRLAAGFESGTVTTELQDRTVVVVGAHLTGMPLNHQLTDRRATLVEPASTSSDYRLYALANTGSVPKPGLVRVEPGSGASVEVEVWTMSNEAFGSFVAGVPSPLCIGSVELSNGAVHQGFLCEATGLIGATDITHLGGWRSYLASRVARQG